MCSRHVVPFRVALAFSPDHHVPVGRLAFEGNVVVFEYDATFASFGLSLNPAFGAISLGMLRPRDPRAFRGLHGVFADSLPDAWGELLLERRLRQDDVAVSSLTVLDRLARVARRGRGALTYEPADDDDVTTDEVDLHRLAHGSGEVLEGQESAVLAELERLGGSSGGARPKVQVALDDSGRARAENGGALPAGFTSWIVKFRGTVDRADIGPLEAAYAEAARRGGIDMPRTRLISTQSGPGYFATERFDRKPEGGRVHMLSIAGMLDADWTVPSIDYETLLGAVRGATRDERAVLQMFRRMVFNVLAINRDDHTKQHALLLDRDGAWRLSPAYDLNPAPIDVRPRVLATPIDPMDSSASLDLALASAEYFGLQMSDARAIVAEVGKAVTSWRSEAQKLGIGFTEIDRMASAFEHEDLRAAVAS